MAKQRVKTPLQPRSIAYFSMEIGLQADIPTYSGGLGILAGDTVRSAADLQIPFVAVTLLPRKGYFHQRLDESGGQIEEPESWKVSRHLKARSARVRVMIEKREVAVRAWQYDAVGTTGFTTSVLFLDTDLPENDERDRRLTRHLYGGDPHYRLCQEHVLGVGGVRMLRALGYEHIRCFHMNEGHAAFLILQLFDEELSKTGARTITTAHIESVRRQCVFTTHTPVPAGHDRFPMEMVRKVVGRHKIWKLAKHFCDKPGTLSMTHLALKFSYYVNGVSKQHGKTSQKMFRSYRIDSITNGVHAATWMAAPFRKLLDRHLPAWREDNFSIRYAVSLPEKDVWNAHVTCKCKLVKYVARHHGVRLDPDVLTIGFARRAAAYKRADLVLQNVSRLRKIAAKAGAFQIVFAGKAHPKDPSGKQLIKRIFRAAERLEPAVRIVYLPNYDIELAKVLIPGVDLWLNTPQPPHEASGTSGMKAALNAVPSLSIPDGWWAEGGVENLTGWTIEHTAKAGKARRSTLASKDARALYDKLEKTIIPMYYADRAGYVRIMRSALALNGSYFNTERMLQEYLCKAYLP